MTVYIDLPIEADPNQLWTDFVTYMQSVFPGWQPNTPNLDVWLAQAFVAQSAETRTVVSGVGRDIFRWFGATIINFPPVDATQAQVGTEWTMIDSAGYTIPAGTLIAIPDSIGTQYPFETIEDVVVPTGTTVVDAVQATAVTAGVASSGLGSPGAIAALLDPLPFVVSIVLDAATAGGQDAEDDQTYLDRLASDLRLLAPRPIVPPDFAQFYEFIPGVFRAAAFDGYNPDDNTYNNPRTISLAGLDAGGNAVGAGIKAQALADLESRREVNFDVHIMDATINGIDVTYQVKALSGYDFTALRAAIDSALGDYLLKSHWGIVNNDLTTWRNQQIVRYLEIAGVIQAVAGVDYITYTAGNYDLQIGLHGGSMVRVDLTLAGIFPITDAVTLSGTIT